MSKIKWGVSFIILIAISSCSKSHTARPEEKKSLAPGIYSFNKEASNSTQKESLDLTDTTHLEVINKSGDYNSYSFGYKSDSGNIYEEIKNFNNSQSKASLKIIKNSIILNFSMRIPESTDTYKATLVYDKVDMTVNDVEAIQENLRKDFVGTHYLQYENIYNEITKKSFKQFNCSKEEIKTVYPIDNPNEAYQLHSLTKLEITKDGVCSLNEVERPCRFKKIEDSTYLKLNEFVEKNEYTDEQYEAEYGMKISKNDNGEIVIDTNYKDQYLGKSNDSVFESTGKDTVVLNYVLSNVEENYDFAVTCRDPNLKKRVDAKVPTLLQNHLPKSLNSLRNPTEPDYILEARKSYGPITVEECDDFIHSLHSINDYLSNGTTENKEVKLNEFNRKLKNRNVVNCVGTRGRTPLTESLNPLRYGIMANVVEKLISNGADVNQRGDYDLTPLHYAYQSRATKSNQEDADIIELLIGKGADENAVSRYGVSVEKFKNWGKN
ncbi:MAG: hypothetical protein H6621_09695 [Halobacteriovoraceae bacterium]|nr:hypothetical protein [Halobacteriovoraceae bacterium]MCB9095329.1 hypothetical protein [Halobacteriovoraceae bacterium]